MRSRTSDLRIPSSDALPLSHRDSGEQVSWLLGSAMSIASCFVHRTRQMVSFKLGKEIEKDVFRLVTSVEQRKISSSISLPSLKLIIFLVLFTKYDGNCCQSVWNGSLSLMLFNCKYHFQSTFSNSSYIVSLGSSFTKVKMNVFWDRCHTIVCCTLFLCQNIQFEIIFIHELPLIKV